MSKPLFCGHLSMALLVGMAAIARPRRHGTPSPPKHVPVAPAPAKLQSCMALITIDTWRFDAIGLSGGARVRTPNLDQLAKSGWYFKRAHTPAPLTTPAHASILTGLDPDHHGIRDLAPEPKHGRIAARLKQRQSSDTKAIVSRRKKILLNAVGA